MQNIFVANLPLILKRFGHTSNKNWWIKNNLTHLYDYIFEKTSSLPEDASISERLYWCKHSLSEKPKCFCGNEVNYKNFTHGYHKTCSRVCNILSPENKAKREQVTFEKYGVINPWYSDYFQQKAKDTKDANWPDENKGNWRQTLKTKRINKIKNNNFEIKEELEYLYDVTDPYIHWTERTYRCKKCQHEFLIEDWMHGNDALRCPKCFPKWSSKYERLIRNYVSELGFEYKIDIRTIIPPKELDIYFEKEKLAIEIHGLLWHSYGTKGQSYTNNAHKEDRNYHKAKYDECRKKGIKLFQIFQNELDNPIKLEIWKSIIANALGKSNVVYARKCIVKEISSKEANVFLTKNHLQGKTSSKYYFALIYNNEIVSLLCVGKSRFNKNYVWEISRFCNLLNTTVVGGFSKLLSYFRKNYRGSIITYADKRYSSGELYKSNGFTELKDSEPNYFYFKLEHLELLSRIQFQKHKLKDKLENFNQSKSESENMFEHGYRRIWDCGNKVFVLR